MSQTPTDEGAIEPGREYLDAWEKLSRMIQQGRSFSGHERDCAFLNIPGSRFADVSAAASLDFIDDGRAVGLTDWDHDGDLDLWLTNRNGPRVRFLRNDVPSLNRFLEVELVGDPAKRTNRDAIGARLELHLAGSPAPRLIRTLYAGDGFLSQSSKWVHFGLGSSSRIERLVVRWPGSREVEEFSALEPDRRYRIVQGTRRAERAPPRPERVSLQPSVPASPPVSQKARIRLSSLPRVPPLSFRDLEGKQRSLSALGRGPLLVNLWATWCAPCLKELQDLARNEKRLRAANLTVLALNVDGLGQSGETDPSRARAVLKRVGFTFPAGVAGAELLDTLDGLQKEAIYRQRQLPLPSSFLIDPEGRLAAVYKGPLEIEELLSDVKTLSSDPKKLRDLAVPFPGRWSRDVFVTHPIAIAGLYLEGGHPDDARAYLERYLASQEVEEGGKEKSPERNLRLADVHAMLGKIARSEGNSTQAVSSFREALRWNPDSLGMRLELGRALAEGGRLEEAAQELEAAPGEKRNDPELLNQLGVVRMRQGRTAEAIEAYRAARGSRPGFPPAASNLAWIRATHPEPRFRDGAEAVRLAREACQASEYKQIPALDTLAAAHAEAGQFAEAVRIARMAIELASLQGKTGVTEEIGNRLRLYQAQRPYRENRVRSPY